MGKEDRRKSIGQILVERGYATEEQIQEALNIQREKGGSLADILLNLGYLTQEQKAVALGLQAGMEVVDLDGMEIPQDVLDRITPSVAKMYRVVPIRFENGVLTVALSDPLDVSVLDDLRFMLECEVQGAIASESSINETIEKYYAHKSESIEDIIGELGEEGASDLAVRDSDATIDVSSVEQLAHSAPVVKLVTQILLHAIKDQASDIHFEPFEDVFKVRYRVDGVLLELIPPPRHLALAVTSRLKVMAQLNIAERRLPQDGRIMLNVGGQHPVDLRVSTLPTAFGESVVLRVLDRTVVSLDLHRLGLRDDELATVKSLIHRPHGIVLVTGPTGSGKTTTLYAALNEANDIGIKIITTEDPVEYDLEGIMQVQVDEKIGVTFGRCLRHILRQDPDKILVGEIRDIETAEIAIQASLTGHVVFSTLHTNDAPSAVTRMIDMGVEPYMLCATLQAVLAQRLVRIICTDCKEEYTPTKEMLLPLRLSEEEVEGKKFYYGRGCPNCNNTGYRGRTAIFEIMMLTDELRDLIMTHASTGAIRQLARQQGMRTLRDSGLMKIYDGTTTIEEVVANTMFAA